MLAARLALAPCLSLLVLLGCHSSPSAPDDAPPPFGGWVITELAEADLDALARAPQVAIGADGTLSGFSGVNRFSGKVNVRELRRGHLVTTPLVTTRMAGTTPAMDAETRFLQLLADPLDWSRDGAELVLARDGEELARLRPE